MQHQPPSDGGKRTDRRASTMRPGVVRRGLRRVRRALGVLAGADVAPAKKPPRPPITYPLGFRKLPRRPAPADDAWPTPPEGEAPPLGWTTYVEVPSAIRFDLDLFEQLNEEYADKPIVPQARTYDVSARTSDAQTRISRVAQFIDLDGTDALEIGCGQGEEVWLLRHKFGCRAFGIDIKPWDRWTVYREHGVSFLVADAAAIPYADASFDRLMSFAAWEHIPHPYRALAEVARLLRPGGQMWLYANLYRGPTASHQYRDIHFPWPHLLFSEDVAGEYFRTRGRNESFYWVNKLTYDTYDRYFELLGLEVVHLGFSEREIDEEFYARFENVLGRYPISDLKRDFFTAVLRKPV